MVRRPWAFLFRHPATDRMFEGIPIAKIRHARLTILLEFVFPAS